MVLSITSLELRPISFCQVKVSIVHAKNGSTYESEIGRPVTALGVIAPREQLNAYPKKTLISTHDISRAVKLSRASRVKVVRKPGFRLVSLPPCGNPRDRSIYRDRVSRPGLGI